MSQTYEELRKWRTLRILEFVRVPVRDSDKMMMHGYYPAVIFRYLFQLLQYPSKLASADVSAVQIRNSRIDTYHAYALKIKRVVSMPKQLIKIFIAAVS